jgi:hypothetical protein
LWNTYCSARIVLPLPRRPDDQVDRIRRQAAAQDRVQSRLAARTPDVLPAHQRALAEQVLDRGDGLQRVKRFFQERIGASGEHLLAGVEARDRHHGHGRDLLERGAEIGARSARDQQLDDRQRGGALAECTLGVLGAERELDDISLATEEILAQLGAVGVTFGEQHQPPGGLPVRLRGAGRRATLELLAQETVGVGGGKPISDPCL